MGTVEGTGTRRLTGQDQVPLGFLMDVEVKVATATRRASVVAVTVRPARRGGAVTSEALAAAAQVLEAVTEEVGAELLARAEVLSVIEVSLAGTLQSSATSSPDFLLRSAGGELIAVDIKQSRRARLTDEDFAEIATVYQRALDEGVSVLDAVAAVRKVSRSQAGALIQQARKRGHLPPARGRGRQSL